MSTIQVDVVSAEALVFSGQATFVALPGESKTAVSKLSLSQKCLFLAAIVLALVPFLAFYISGLMNLV